MNAALAIPHTCLQITDIPPFLALQIPLIREKNNAKNDPISVICKQADCN